MKRKFLLLLCLVIAIGTYAGVATSQMSNDYLAKECPICFSYSCHGPSAHIKCGYCFGYPDAPNPDYRCIGLGICEGTCSQCGQKNCPNHCMEIK